MKPQLLTKILAGLLVGVLAGGATSLCSGGGPLKNRT